MGPIFTKDNPTFYLKDYFKSACSHHTFLRFKPLDLFRDYTPQNATRALQGPAPPRATSSQPTLPRMQRDDLTQLRKTARSGVLGRQRPLPAHLGAAGPLQHLLGERDHVGTTGVHFLGEKPLDWLTKSCLRIRGTSRHPSERLRADDGEPPGPKEASARERGGVSPSPYCGKMKSRMRLTDVANWTHLKDSNWQPKENKAQTNISGGHGG